MKAHQEKSHSGLEVLRFLSAVAVVFWHYQHFHFIAPDTLDPAFQRDAQPLHGLLGFFYDQGYMSVSLFWEISGFIFFWKYHEAVRAGEVTSWRFFALRFSRLYPLHVATWGLVAVLQIVYATSHQGASFAFGNNDLRHFLLGLGFASNWGFETGLSFNGPIWSVSREVVIYAVFFALSSVLRTGILLRIGLVGLAIALWFGNDRFIGSSSTRVFLTCAVYFFMGGLVQAVVARLSRRLLQLAAVIALPAAIAIALMMFRDADTTSKVAILAFVTLMLVAALGAETFAPVNAVMARMAPLADTTYSSYLIHFPIQLIAVIVTDGLGYGRDVYSSPVALVLFLAAVFGLGWVVYHRFELPAQTLIRKALLHRASRRQPQAG